MNDPSRLIAVSSALTVVAALLFWAFNGAESDRLPIVIAAGIIAGLVSYFVPMLLMRTVGLPPDTPVNVAIGTGAWALAIGVGAGWSTPDVVGLVCGTSVIALIVENVRRRSARS